MSSNTPKWEDTQEIKNNGPKWDETHEVSPSNSNFSELESAGLGALQGGTLGYADEIEGALRGAGAKLSGKDKDLIELYKEYRDIARKRNDQAKSQNPLSFGAGNLAAGAATAFIPGAISAKLAKAATSIPGLVATGAATGLGSSDADLTQGDVKGAAIDTAVGGALGYGAGKLGEKIGKALTPEATQARASARAVKALGEKALPENLPMGQAVLDEGLLPVMGGSKATLKGITDRMSGLEKGVVQPTLDAVSQNAGLQTAVAGRKPIADIVSDVAQDAINGIPQSSVSALGKKAIERTAKYWSAQLEAAGGDPKKLNELRKLIDAEAKQAGAFGANPDLKPKADFLAKLRDAVNDELRGISSDVSTGAGTGLETAMGRQSALYGAKDAAEKLVEKDAIHPPGSIIDAIKNPFSNPRAAVTGAAYKLNNPYVSAAAGGGILAEKVTQQPIGRLGNILSAKFQNQMAKGLDTSTGKAVAQGVEAFASKGLASSGVQSGIQSLYSVNDDKLKQVAEHFSQQDNTKNLAEALNNAIVSGDEDSKNRVIFAMEQRPDIRSQLKELLEMQNEDNYLTDDPNG